MRPVLLFAVGLLGGIGCLLPRIDISETAGDGSSAGGTGGREGGAGLGGIGGARDASHDTLGDEQHGGSTGSTDGNVDRSATGGSSGRGGTAGSSDVSSEGMGGSATGGSAGTDAGGGGAGRDDGSAGTGGGFNDAAGAAGAVAKDAGPFDVSIGDTSILDTPIVDARLDPACVSNEVPTHCANNIPQFCDSDGSWRDAAPCTADRPTCEDGRCVCKTTICNNVCVDTNVDPFHCARCNHSCLGGACAQGQCQPVTLASGYPFPHGIAVDAQHVYWTNYGNDALSNVGSVLRANLDGSDVTTLAANQDKPTRIIVTADNLFWSNYGTNAGDGRVMKLALTSGSSPTTMAAGLTSPSDLAFDGTSIYFATNTNPGAIFKQGVTEANPTTLIAAQNSPYGVEVDASFVYWTNNGAGTVMRATLAGANTLVLSSGETEPWDIAADANNVYFGTLSAIRRVPRSGGGAVDHASGQSNPWGIAVDDTGVYWANHNARQITRLAPGSNMPVAIATAENPGYIALDATCIYWTETVSPGQVKKLAK